MRDGGGGAAGLTKGVTAMVRAKSTLFTGGVGNHVVATAELGSAILVPLLALAAPFVALALVILLLWVAFRMLRRLRRPQIRRPRRTRPRDVTLGWRRQKHSCRGHHTTCKHRG